MSIRVRFLRKSSNVVRIQIADGETLNDSPIVYPANAVITAQLYDDADTSVAGPITLEYVADTDGVYRGIFQYEVGSPLVEFNPAAGTNYYLKVIVNLATPDGTDRVIIAPAHVTDG